MSTIANIAEILASHRTNAKCADAIVDYIRSNFETVTVVTGVPGATDRECELAPGIVAELNGNGEVTAYTVSHDVD